MIDEPESPQDSEINIQQPKQQEDADEEPSPVFDTMNSEINPRLMKVLFPHMKLLVMIAIQILLPKENPKPNWDSHIPPPP
ncbi:hypothetical protein JCM33374_g5254 [Metschnikowia sp. JCM 33374]|nr:hypothetical protein JCM33374_g5254 [Metschnikowia sp. JCM 33374]